MPERCILIVEAIALRMETIGTVLSVAIIASVGSLFVRWYWNGDERLNSEWFN